MDRDCKRRKHIRNFSYALAAASLLSIADLAVKWVVITIVMNPPRRIPVLPFFDIVLVFNSGMSFGLFSDMGAWGPKILSGVAIGIIGLLIVWLWRVERMNEVIGIVLVIGGAIGNVIDRVHNEAVTDFLSLYVGQYHWPVFNIADVFITIGVICLLLPNFGSELGVAHSDKVARK
ncbi:signal peptidase II [uncultured Sneathiella sp.]|jgi:signal peptidase II|uniref:signal peptidase II n=1 Tax=uncultured Sneathiella sp. TaxID=879315 RepID=UPI0030D792B7|tara:strand:+ start:4065 stop:4592 length:528 start_codon:yes stop_codon:yes gene_type:complete